MFFVGLHLAQKASMLQPMK